MGLRVVAYQCAKLTTPRLSIPILLTLLAFNASAQSSRPGLGSTLYADAGGTGVTFRVWAPNAANVSVVGDFNGWNGSVNPLVAETNGLWSLDVTNAAAGAKYQYLINGTLWRRDPRSRKVTHSNGDSIVYDTNAFTWADDYFSAPFFEDMVLYEMHVKAYNGSFDANIDRLEHLHAMGVNAIELMPVSEFKGDYSWGYEPADLFAVESSYGGAEGMRKFVDECHKRGMAVLVDVVHNHWGPSDLATWQFDGWHQNGRGGIYFYNEDGKCCTDWGETRPDASRQEVRDFIKDNTRMWLEEYHVDGFRFDSPWNMTHYMPGFTHIPEASSLMQEVNSLIHNDYTGKISISEDDGLSDGYDSEWSDGFHSLIESTVSDPADAHRDMNALAAAIGNGAGHGRVVYSESHDSVGDLNHNNRLPKVIDDADPTSYWARKRSLLAGAVVMTMPGIPMVMQGQEILEGRPFSDHTPIDWWWAQNTPATEITSAYTDMIHARRNLRGGTKGLTGTGCNVHHVDNVNKVIAYHRWYSGGEDDDVVVVANFAITEWTNSSYEIEFPYAGTWYAHFNSDDLEYGSDFGDIGPTSVTAAGSPPQAAVDMGDYSVLIFSRTPPAGSGTATYAPQYPSGCDDITVTYDPAGGPLAGKTNIQIYAGTEGWHNSANLAMSTNLDGTWSFVFTNVVRGTKVINYVFNDGGSSWDNNHKKNWYAVLKHCNVISDAQFSFTTNSGCPDVIITYDSAGGPLSGSTGVAAFMGRDDWKDTDLYPMIEISPGLWTVTNDLLEATEVINVAFKDDADNWDNRFGTNWNVQVPGCADDTGSVIFDPESAYGCEPVTIIYDPEAGVLQGINPLYIHIGHSDWQDTQDVAMTLDTNGLWTYTYDTPGGAWEINCVFHDNAGTWDNHYGANWKASVYYCQPETGALDYDPPSPQGCNPITITFSALEGPLKDASQVLAYVNGETIRPGMTEISNNVWQMTYYTPPGTWSVWFQFHDDAGTWDSNNGWWYYVPVNGCEAAGDLVITNPITETFPVAKAQMTIDLTGTVTPDLTTHPLQWTNSLTGASGTIPADTNWSIPGIALGSGTNAVTVSAIQISQPAFDSASDPVYTNGWKVNMNGGAGFHGWDFYISSSNAGAVITTNSDIGNPAWGLFSSDNSSIWAYRLFERNALPGDLVKVKFDNGGVDGYGGFLRLSFKSENYYDFTELRFDAGTTNYVLINYYGSVDTGIPWTDQGMQLTFSLSADPGQRSYSLQIDLNAGGSHIFTNTIPSWFDYNVGMVRIINDDAGLPGQNNSNRILHINDVEIVPGPGYPESDTIDVVRAGILDTDSDGIDDDWENDHGLNVGTNDAALNPDSDSFDNGDEFILDSDPFASNAVFTTTIEDVLPNEVVRIIAGPSTTNSRLYDVYWCTNLMDAAWLPRNIVTPGNGGNLMLTITNDRPAVYYRAGVRRP
ncbi:MAG: alpha amylase C-terminal domain-containing protein [Verrucomicrobia bacterium]|nr:alpha amylase C-terminal domain-containing protein [Verrucomicrobiota bacterium]